MFYMFLKIQPHKMKLLDGKIIKKEYKNKLQKEIHNKKWNWKTVAIFLLQQHKPSEVYINLKKKFWEKIWLKVDIYSYKNMDFVLWKDDIDLVINNINMLNNDSNCLGIVVQLPLPHYMERFKEKVLSSISPLKDIDWLWWVLFGLSSISQIDFVPATPASVLNILKYYHIDDFQWKLITIIWQSNLVGKPLALEIIKRWWEVLSFNEFVDQNLLQEFCRKSDYIISATGKVHLIDDNFLRDDKSQILVDVWWWIKDGKAVGDINFEKVKDKIAYITPVPGGVWPMTVASLFDNIRILQNQKHLIPTNFVW